MSNAGGGAARWQSASLRHLDRFSARPAGLQLQPSHYLQASGPPTARRVLPRSFIGDESRRGWEIRSHRSSVMARCCDTDGARGIQLPSGHATVKRYMFPRLSKLSEAALTSPNWDLAGQELRGTSRMGVTWKSKRVFAGDI